MPTLRMWSWALSPYAGKARAAFAEKGVEVELLEIDPARRQPALKQANPLMRVPVLLVDGRPIRESSAICEWLEETHPEPALWPADPVLRGWARGWARWLDDHATQSFFLGLRKQAFGLDAGDPEDLVAQLHGRVPKSWKNTERALSEHDGPWLCGDELTYADLSGLALAVRLPQWKPELQPDAADWPLTAAWLQALRARPSAAAIDHAGPLAPAAAA